MPSVAIHPPKTPVTKGSSGVASATIPNVCKMPGPPAPFVPSPLPNIAKSGTSPKGYSKKVKIEGQAVAIRGATFKSMGDMASKGTGGGLISANTHGPAKFITPGSMTVKIEGKSVHLLSEPMLNNCGASGSPPNTGATMLGLVQGIATIAALEKELERIAKECEEEVENDPKHQNKSCRERGTEKHKCCDRKLDELQDKNADQQVFSDGAFDSSTGDIVGRNNPVSGRNPARVPRTRGAIMNQAIGFAKHTGGSVGGTIGAMLSGKKFPDVVVSLDGSQPPNPGNVDAVYDFKFPCPKEKNPTWGDGGKQKRTYDELLSPLRPPRMVSPKGIF